LTLPKGKVTLSPENQKRATDEALLLKKMWPHNTPKKWNGRFTSPTGTEVSTVFGVKRIMNEKKTSVHRGMDFRGKKGAPVRAINGGRVVLTDDLFFGGNTLIVDHGMGLYSVYMHLSKFNAKKGVQVKAEQVIGFIGSTGRTTGPHLHMSVKLNGVSVNPESLFELDL
ncbi:MAG: M23 family metallopeptidase, partial [Nitrospirota bacterium]